MFNITTGEIILCHLKFSINPSLTPLQLESEIPNLLISHYITDTNYLHYYVWCDIEPHEFVYTDICFFGNALHSIKILPQQHVRTISEKRSSNMDLDTAQNLAYAWYHKFFAKNELTFSWGRIRFCAGSDPIYGSPHILIRYM